jgi:hypothetical protein
MQSIEKCCQIKKNEMENRAKNGKGKDLSWRCRNGGAKKERLIDV